ncbi:MAG: hypothetical protein FH761_18560 [Firmicutes bacterium]|nr:hypothetical protein [Bacillota bacterium]
MSEKALVPSKENKSILQNNFIILLLPLLLLFIEKDSKNSPFKNILEPINNTIKSLDLNNTFKSLNLNNTFKSLNLENISKTFDPRTIAPKIEVLKKVGPYLPENHIPTVNNLVLTFEKVNRIMSLVDFVSTSNSYEPIYSAEVTSNKERLANIINVLKDEIPDDKAKTIRPILDIVTNTDKVKSVVNVASSVLNPSKKSQFSIEDIIELALPFLEGNKNFNKDKVKEVMGMVEMLKLLNDDDDKDKESKE